MVGRLGDFAVAAAGSASHFVGIARLTIFGIATGNAILTSQFKVNNNKEGITKSLITSVVSNLMFSGIFITVYFTQKSFILNSFTSNRAIQLLIQEYLDIGIFSSVTLSLIYSTVLSLRSRSIVKPQYITACMLLIINGFLNYTLIFGNLGFPKLGLRGAAIATISSEVIVLISIIIVDKLFKYGSFSNWRSTIKLIDREFLITYFRLSFPILSANLLWSVSTMLIHNIFGVIGKNALAAYGVLTPIDMFVSHLFAGFAGAILVIVGQELGKNNFKSAYSLAKKTSLLGIVSSIPAALLIYLCSDKIVTIYNVGVPVQTSLANMLKIFALFFPFKIFNSISFNGTFRSGGDTPFLFWIAALSSWLLVLPVAKIGYYLFNWNESQLYLCINMMEIIIFIICIWRLRSKKWMRNLVEGENK
jgi:putative MATE family efflux protein